MSLIKDKMTMDDFSFSALQSPIKNPPQMQDFQLKCRGHVLRCMTPSGRERFADVRVPLDHDLTIDTILRALLETEGRCKANPAVRAKYTKHFKLKDRAAAVKASPDLALAAGGENKNDTRATATASGPTGNKSESPTSKRASGARGASPAKS